LKIKAINPVKIQSPGWLYSRFKDCYAQISTDTTMKLKSSIKDVFRVLHGRVDPTIETICGDLPQPPQGIADNDFVFGYKDGNGSWVPGIIETNALLQKFVENYSKEWEIVKKCLGTVRQKSRHACLPAGELIFLKSEGLVDIIKCHGKFAYTGQNKVTRPGRFAASGLSTLICQGEREVIEYTLDTGKTIRCTPDHQVLTAQGWMEIHTAFKSKVPLQKAANRIRLLESDAQKYAANRDGYLLKWGGKASAFSEWRCSEGHVWTGRFSRIFSYEHWCRKCSYSSRFQPTKKYVSLTRQAGKCLNTYRRYDRAKGLVGDLMVADVEAAKQSPCTYCGRMSTGFERINNSLGHMKENCVPACLRCNWMRGKYISHDTMLKVGALLKEIDP